MTVDNRLPCVKLNGFTYVKRALDAQIEGSRSPHLWICCDTGRVADPDSSLAREVQGAWEDENR